MIRSVGFERTKKQASLCALHFSTVWRMRGPCWVGLDVEWQQSVDSVASSNMFLTVWLVL